ncbi:hypothetical protein Dimus_037315, partial [Dionaea muscipula]
MEAGCFSDRQQRFQFRLSNDTLTILDETCGGNIVDFGSKRDQPWILMENFNTFIYSTEEGYFGIAVEPCGDLMHCCYHARIEDSRASECLHTRLNNQGVCSW